ncbi:MAG: CDP-diacylglycerol--glycerol-3-phosphate 3-phosphatidyltransferase [Erysipelotrichaceae bacterium]|nr:CDP-diacylglycerol--glycerol-3-phosphate 3-phosphatidyltransferase [Erysipelotrichaceae bacterium]
MNLPNKISMFRLFLIPIIVFAKLFPFAQFGIMIPYLRVGFVTISSLNLVLLALFLVASISDFLDGFIARKYNQITTLGKFIDPIADKALTTTMFILFAIDGIIPPLVVLIMVWRDILVDGIRMMCAERGVVVAAGLLGKAKTVAQMVAIVFVLLNNLPFALVGVPFADIMIWLSVFLSVISGVSYFIQAKDLIFETK